MVPRGGDLRRHDVAALPERRARRTSSSSGQRPAVDEHPARGPRHGLNVHRRGVRVTSTACSTRSRVWNYARDAAGDRRDGELAASRADDRPGRALGPRRGRRHARSYGSAGTTVNGTITGSGLELGPRPRRSTPRPRRRPRRRPASRPPRSRRARSTSPGPTTRATRPASRSSAPPRAAAGRSRRSPRSGPASPCTRTTRPRRPRPSTATACARSNAVGRVRPGATPACATTPAEPAHALDFGGTNGYVDLRDRARARPSAVHARDVVPPRRRRRHDDHRDRRLTDAIPLVTKGRGEAEGSNVDMNYFLGIRERERRARRRLRGGLGRLVAGPQPPGRSASRRSRTASGTTPRPPTTAATWRLYLNGTLENELYVGQPPQSSTHPARRPRHRR